MIHRRATLAAVLLVGVLAVAACTAETGATGFGGITVDGVRRAAVAAGPSPATCPVRFDVGAALPAGRSVRPGKVEVLTSKTTTPAPDPIAAQRDQGMSALDAAAGVSIDCAYRVGDRILDAWLVVLPRKGAIAVMAPRITRAAHLDITQVRAFLDHQPEPGDVALTPGGDVAVARVRVQGDGDASLLVDPDGVVTGDALTKVAATLLGQIHG